ncbi:MAG: DnaJ domain-containing protein [Oscillospiraceae bacterium]|jgi:diguanylate cyclase (GGDEF)-like protein|nr:DnaJ domain-containing protein [Oscillospiraceae bacterium]
MEPWEDYYKILQVDSEAEAEVIQSAYKRLSLKYHPDVNSSDEAQSIMRLINDAYAVLGDERKRRLYHRRWELHGKFGRMGASGGVAPVRERVVYRIPDPDPYGGGTRGAYEAVMLYFRHIQLREYREAFAIVSDQDKKRFNYGSFVEWQESVSALYEIGNIKLKLFRRYPDLKIDAGLRFAAEEFTVTIAEKNKQSDRVENYAISKYAISENGVWKVYLGYRDLTPLVMQFKTMVSNREEAQIAGLWQRYKDNTDLETGLPNRAAFEAMVEAETYRQKRYRRPFSVALFSLRLPDRVTDAGHKDRVTRYVGYIISNAIRLTDGAACFGDLLFGVVLGETDLEAARAAARKITSAVLHDIAACFDFEVSLRVGLTEYDGHTCEEMLDKCLRALNAQGAENNAPFAHLG